MENGSSRDNYSGRKTPHVYLVLLMKHSINDVRLGGAYPPNIILDEVASSPHPPVVILYELAPSPYPPAVIINEFATSP